MKKFALMLLCQIMLLSLSAQTEPFIKSLRKLSYGSTLLDAGMLFKKDFPQFKAVVQGPILMEIISDPDDSTKTYRVEAYFQVSEEGQQLIQLYYVDNQLYEKGAYWYYPSNSGTDISEVEAKYQRCVNYFKSDHFMIQKGHGVARGNEVSSNNGKKTIFPLQDLGMDKAQGEAGYKLLYNQSDGPMGFWVYMEGMNSINLDINRNLSLPEMAPPEVTFAELESRIRRMDQR